jgi:hypothetical protein
MTFEPIGLMMFAFLAGGLFIFFNLTSEVVEGDTRAFDERILLALRTTADLSIPVGPYWLSHAFDDITALGGTTVLSLMTIMGTTYLLLARQRAIAIFMFLSILGGWLVSNALKLGVARPRPDIVPHLIEVHDLSFPSGHAFRRYLSDARSTPVASAAVSVHPHLPDRRRYISYASNRLQPDLSGRPLPHGCAGRLVRRCHLGCRLLDDRPPLHFCKAVRKRLIGRASVRKGRICPPLNYNSKSAIPVLFLC